VSALYGLAGRGGDLSLLRRMGERLTHRGAHAREWSPAPGVFLGQRGPAAAAGSEAGRLAADATLYNAAELAGRLNGSAPPPGNRGPAALLERAFAAWGTGCFALLDGDFTAAVWDERGGRLVLARDPLGVRSLYTWEGPDLFAFASEYKAILALPCFAPVPDREALQHLQRSKYLPPGRTLLAGVRPLAAGRWVEVRDGRLAGEQAFWRIAVEPSSLGIEAAERGLRERFLAAVDRRTERCGTLGAELSGGVDSAAVVAAMRQVRPDAAIKTFTVGDGPDDPEVLGARFAADALGTDHHEVFAEPECLAEALPAVIWHLEDPIGRTETVLYYQMMRAASRHVDVVLGGYASDGLFAGMPKHKLVRLRQLSPLGARALEDFYHYTQWSQPPGSALGRALRRAWYGGGELPAPSILGAPPAAAPPPLPGRGRGALNQVLLEGMMEGVPAFMPKVEKPHAAHGVELRTPFADPELIRFSFGLPEGLKIHGLRDKYVLRRALKPLLPAAVARRPKFPQAMGYGPRLSEALDDLAGRLLAPDSIRARGFFDPEEIAALRRRRPGKPYTPNRAMRLWTVLATELWARLFLDRRGAWNPFSFTDLI
jgi:asparagine synthase (glutamine-hydrolysing)